MQNESPFIICFAEQTESQITVILQTTVATFIDNSNMMEWLFNLVYWSSAFLVIFSIACALFPKRLNFILNPIVFHPPHESVPREDADEYMVTFPGADGREVYGYYLPV